MSLAAQAEHTLSPLAPFPALRGDGGVLVWAPPRPGKGPRPLEPRGFAAAFRFAAAGAGRSPNKPSGPGKGPRSLEPRGYVAACRLAVAGRRTEPATNRPGPARGRGPLNPGVMLQHVALLRPGAGRSPAQCGRSPQLTFSPSPRRAGKGRRGRGVLPRLPPDPVSHRPAKGESPESNPISIAFLNEPWYTLGIRQGKNSGFPCRKPDGRRPKA